MHLIPKANASDSGDATLLNFWYKTRMATLNTNSYLLNIIKKYSIPADESKQILSRIRPLYREIRNWAGEYLVKILPSGSFAKGTAIRGAVDIDLLISLKNQTPKTLKEIYESLYANLSITYPAQKQNVSIGIHYQGIKLDLVPAKKMPNMTYPHSIYVSKLDTWTKTNIHKHITLIKKTPHKNIIRLLKIWRYLHDLEFSSFLLEMTVLEALKGLAIARMDKKFLLVLEYLYEDFPFNKIYDPANSNNAISDTISDVEKSAVSQAAAESLGANCWEKVVWGLYEKK